MSTTPTSPSAQPFLTGTMSVTTSPSSQSTLTSTTFATTTSSSLQPYVPGTTTTSLLAQSTITSIVSLATISQSAHSVVTGTTSTTAANSSSLQSILTTSTSTTTATLAQSILTSTTSTTTGPLLQSTITGTKSSRTVTPLVQPIPTATISSTSANIRPPVLSTIISTASTAIISPPALSTVASTTSTTVISLSAQSLISGTAYRTTVTTLSPQTTVTCSMSTATTSSSAATGPIPTPTTISASFQTAGNNLEITQEETNYLRLTALVLKIAPRALRQLFDMHISPSNLSQKINEQTNKDRLIKLKERRVINQDQWNIMYPPSGRVSSTDFDLTLMVVLLKEICGITAPPNGWSRLPHVHDYSEGAEITRVSFYRNKVIHGSRFSINNHEFNGIWSDIKQTLIRVGGRGFTAEIDALLVCSLDQSYKELYKELKSLKMEPKIPPSMQAYQHDKLEGWMNDDIAYVQTRTTQATIDMLESNGIMTLIGPPGCGKSTTAHHIAIQLHNKGYSVYPVKTIKDIVDYWIPELDQVFVIDDPFGVHDVNISAINAWEMYKDVLDVCFKYSYLKIFMTIRLQIIQGKRMEDIQQNLSDSTISFVDESLTLTSTERISIFQTYASLYVRDDLLRTELEQIQEFKISCFPLLCRIYAADMDSNHSVENFFKRPMTIIDDEITQLKKKDPVRYFCLLLCMIYDNSIGVNLLKVSVESSKEKEKREDVLEICGLSRTLSRVEIESNMNTLLNTFLVKEGDTFRFIHDLIHDSVVKHVSRLSSDVHKIILKHCSPSFIRERIRLISIKSKDADSCINLQEDMESTWGGRLLKDVHDGYWFDVFGNISLSHDYCDKILAKELSTCEQTSVKALMCSVKFSMGKLLNQVLDKSNKALNIDNCFLSTPCTAFHFAIAAGLKHVITKVLTLTKQTVVRDLNSVIDTLSLACFANQKDVVRVLIDNGASFNNVHEHVPFGFISSPHPLKDNYYRPTFGICMYNGKLPLHIAASEGYDTVVQVLIDSGADLNKCTNDGESPLYIASYHGHDTVVQMLIDNGADVNKCSNDGKSPLYIASYHERDTVVQMLIDNGADVNKCSNDGKSPLYIASYRGRDTVVQMLIDNGADVNKCKNNGESPLYTASSCVRGTVVQLLIDNGADVNKCNKVGESPLYIASNNGHDTVVQLLIDNGADVNKCNDDGKSPLYIASYQGHDTVVQLLIDNGADVNKCNKVGESPLYIASNNGHDTVVQLLIDNGADVNKCNDEGKSPLYIASYQGHDTVVQLLIDNGADVNKCSNNGKSPLYIASSRGREAEHVPCGIFSPHSLKGNMPTFRMCRYNGKSLLHIAASKKRYDTVVQVLIDNGADVNKCTNDGESPLYIASYLGHDTVVQLLIDNGADVNKCDNGDNDGISPLYAASTLGHDPVVQILIENGADVNKCYKGGTSPLFIASYRGHDTVVQLLIDNGADVNKCDNDGESPLYIASNQGNDTVVQLLIDNEADVDICNNDGESPLYIASSKGRDKTVQLLKDNGADVNKCNNDGQSLLYIASYQGHDIAVKLLIDNGADVNKCNNDGKSPLYIASSRGHDGVVPLLIDNGADVHICDKNGISPLYIASYLGNSKVVHLLINNGFDVNKCKISGAGEPSSYISARRQNQMIARGRVKIECNEHGVSQCMRCQRKARAIVGHKRPTTGCLIL